MVNVAVMPSVKVHEQLLQCFLLCTLTCRDSFNIHKENTTAALLEIATVLANLHHVFSQMSSLMATLMARLDGVQNQSAIAVR